MNEKENSFEKCEIIFSNSGGAFRFPDSVAIELIKMPEEQKQRRRRVVHIKLFQEGMKQKKRYWWHVASASAVANLINILIA